MVVGKRGRKDALADKRQMCLLQTKEGNFQHSFVLANFPARVCLGEIVDFFKKNFIGATGLEPVVLR